MNLISILYLANNKVGLMAQFLPFKLGVMSSIPEKKKKKSIQVNIQNKQRVLWQANNQVNVEN